MSTRHQHHSESRAYLCAPVNALVEGIFKENISFREIKQHGDFALGTFDDLDGEMLMLDGQIYQIRADGSVARVDEHGRTPFACVTFFKPTASAVIEQELSYLDFVTRLEGLLLSPNLLYAIRIRGRFAHLKARSVKKQEHYRPLVEAAGEQSTFEFNNIEGTLAGFFTPAFMSSLNVPGLHLHFLSADRERGGHILECRPASVRVEWQLLTRVELSLPMTREYLALHFPDDVTRDLEQVEK